MKRLAIVIAAVMIFTLAWSTANSQAELNQKFEKYAKTSNHVEPKPTKQTKKPVQDTPDVPKQADTPKPDKVPTKPAKVAVIAPKTVKQSSNTCGPQSPSTIYSILREINVPRSSAIQLIGSWKHESGLDPCQKRGDGGIAWGLNSWHPARRYDMPETLREQVIWAVQTEMKRDCASCHATIMNGGDTYTIRSAIQKSTRWGVLGNRWVYADQFASMF